MQEENFGKRHLEAQKYMQNVESTLLQARVNYWKLGYGAVFSF